jgi:hypothetical protein
MGVAEGGEADAGGGGCWVKIVKNNVYHGGAENGENNKGTFIFSLRGLCGTGTPAGGYAFSLY